jgi:hypothetical protein
VIIPLAEMIGIDLAKDLCAKSNGEKTIEKEAEWKVSIYVK